MTDNEAIERIIKSACSSKKCHDGCLYGEKNCEYDAAIIALKEVQRYREMDRRLREAYGDCDGLLETAVDGFCKHSNVDIGNPIKARLLTDEDVDKWDAYREIGTVEECREAVEKQKPKKPKDVEYDYSYFVCDACGEGIYVSDDFESHHYCLNCGQAIQWDEDLEETEDEL